MKSKKLYIFGITLNKGELKFSKNRDQRRKPATYRWVISLRVEDKNCQNINQDKKILHKAIITTSASHTHLGNDKSKLPSY